MAVTREIVEGQIAAKMEEGKTRQEAIDDLLQEAKKGAGRAEKEVTLAQDALTRAKTEEEIKKLDGVIASEGRFAALERDRIVFLNQIAKEDVKKYQ